jgi:hypothetical protein
MDNAKDCDNYIYIAMDMNKMSFFNVIYSRYIWRWRQISELCRIQEKSAVGQFEAGLLFWHFLGDEENHEILMISGILVEGKSSRLPQQKDKDREMSEGTRGFRSPCPLSELQCNQTYTNSLELSSSW